jgi:tetratricopeptide (TPR) repeat protein
MGHGFYRLSGPLAARSRPAERDLRKAEDVSNLSRGARRRTRGARGQRLSLSRVFQRTLDPRRLRIRFTQNALPQRKDRLERFHGLAEIAERGGVLLGERQRVNPPSNYAVSLKNLDRFEEAKSLLRKSIPVARRVLGETDVLTLRMRWLYAMALYEDPDATLDDLREAVERLESVARVWTRVFGEAHPETQRAQGALKDARKALATRTA